jgi:hypothetical protein
MPRRKWSREKIIEEIRRLAEEGHPLNISKVRKEFSSLVSIACSKKYFGSWRAAVEAAGINYNDVIKAHKWTKEEIIERIKSLYSKGEDLRPKALSKDKENAALLSAARDPRYFGSWRAAVEAAGINYDEVAKQMREREVEQIKESILKEIRQLYEEKGPEEIKSAWKNHPKLFRKARHRFGSWQKAVEAAGLNYTEIVKRRKWTKEDIIEAIRKLYAEGKDLRISAVQREAPALLASAQSKSHFGSWRKAVEAAGINYDEIIRRKPTKATTETEQSEKSN